MFDPRGTGRVAEAKSRRTSRPDAGSAMLVVMAAAMILFVIAAAVVGIVVFQQTQQSHAQSVTRATSLAQQGMEVYLTQIRKEFDYWKTTPRIQGSSADGTWTVAATGTAQSHVIITSVGHDRASGQAQSRPRSLPSRQPGLRARRRGLRRAPGSRPDFDWC